MLTVVIPSYERQKYLVHAIRSCINYSEVNVLVNDNSQRKIELNNFFSEDELSRIEYSWTSKKISVVENFSRNFNSIKSKYVSFIGDDDALGVGIEEVIDFMEKQNIESVTMKPGKALHYFWEESYHPLWGDISNTLFFDKYSCRLNEVDIKRQLQIANSMLGDGPQGLPRLYLGIVRTEVVKKIIRTFGNIFGGYSPDIYSSILLSYNLKNAFYIDNPIIIPGACRKSTSGLRSERKDIGNLVGDNHLSRFKNLNWKNSIPEVYTPYTVWGCTHLLALEKVSKEIYSKNLTNYLIAKLILEVPFSRKEAFKKFNEKLLVDKLNVFVQIIKIITRKFFRAIKTLIKQNPGGATFKKNELNTILEAVKHLRK